MEYKNIIKEQNLRFKILKLLWFIPDETMLKLQYRIKTGRTLNIINPKRYTEKLQWYKLFYRNPLMTKCSDKYEVRKYVKSKGLESILNTIYEVHENTCDIDYAKLPEAFAIKCTSGSGSNLFVKNKNDLNEDSFLKTLNRWMGNDNDKYGREWCYYNIRKRIIVEKLIDRDEHNDIPDYKFFCFNGKVKYLYIMIKYVDNHHTGQCSFYTPDFKKLPYRRSEYGPIEKEIEMPENFNKMIRIAEILSEDFPHVRVDLYNIRGQIIFGELTFYSASGYTKFYPDEFDFILGKEFELP